MRALQRQFLLKAHWWRYKQLSLCCFQLREFFWFPTPTARTTLFSLQHLFLALRLPPQSCLVPSSYSCSPTCRTTWVPTVHSCTLLGAFLFAGHTCQGPAAQVFPFLSPPHSWHQLSTFRKQSTGSLGDFVLYSGKYNTNASDSGLSKFFLQSQSLHAGKECPKRLETLYLWQKLNYLCSIFGYIHCHIWE